MAQLHFSVDEATAKRIAREAKRRGMSVSRYLASLLEIHDRGSWPADYIEGVVGSCADSGLREPAELPLDDIDLVRR